MGKTVTLSDIAKACGTSNVTVSKALSNKKGVSEELREKIKEVAQQMGYVSVHSEFAVKNNYMVGVLIPDKFMNPNGSFYWALYNSLVKVFRRRNYFCLIETLSQNDENDLVLPRLVSEGKVTSLISLGQLSKEYVEKLKETRLPIILLDYYITDSDVDAVITNGYMGGYELTSYLIRLGHRDIGFIGTVKATTSIFDRYMGFMKAMLENGLEVRKEWTLDDRDNREFIKIPFPDKLPTAFICNCDETALHAIRQLEELGYSIPDDISIVGYDNYLISEISKPSITTIDVDANKMASAAVDMLIRRIGEPTGPAMTMTIDGTLIEKGSSKKI